MSAERFFDDLARTLAEPMPRRRAVRVIGASIAALAVPGVSPRLALGAANTSTQVACKKKGQNVCNFTNPDRSPGPSYCCPYPPQQWDCSSNSMVRKCINHCPAKIYNGVVGRTLDQKPTFSTKTDAAGGPVRYRCCVVPDTIPDDGECLPNCKLILGPTAIQCGQRCCGPGQECVSWISSNAGSPTKKSCAAKCKKGERRCPPTPGHFPVCCAQACCGGACCEAGEECTLAVSRSGPTFKLCRPKCKAPEKRCDTGCCRDEQRFYKKNVKGMTMCRCIR